MASGLEQVFAQGAAALDADDLPGAEQIFRSIVESQPRAHPAWNALSVVAVRSGFPELALERARHALELDRRNPVYLNNLGVAYGELGLFADSEQAFRSALKAKPVYAEALFNLGKVLHKLGRRDEALRAYERAYAMNAEFPGLRGALLHMYCKTGRAERALAEFKKLPEGSIARDWPVLFADILGELEGAQPAVAWLREQLVRHPERHEIRYSFAQRLLALEQWREGWREYLFRPQFIDERTDAESGALQPPPLLPQRLDGKSVRLRRDQGLGDHLFYLRFLPELKARGASVAVMASRNLARILRGDYEVIVEEEFVEGARTWDHDLWICDLPALLDTTAVPGAFPLTAEGARVERLRMKLASLGPAPYLGLTWRAGTDVLRNAEFRANRGSLSKGLPFAELGRAVRGWPGTLLALQRGPYAGEIEGVAAAAGAAVHDFTALNDDLAEMLALLALLDEYVAVSNTNVHMLAGLGRGARLLAPHPAEWRWGVEGASPWFPASTVYREPQARGWTQPLAQLRSDLIG